MRISKLLSRATSILVGLVALTSLSLSPDAVGEPPQSPSTSGQQQSAGTTRKQAESSAMKEVKKRLMGDWEIASGVNQGKKLSSQDVAGSHAMVSQDTIVVLDVSEKELYKAQFELKLRDRQPHWISMTTDMPNTPRTEALGILEFNRQGWRLAYALPGSDRPTKFESTPDEKIMLFQFKPAKKPTTPKLKEASNVPE